MTNPWYEVVDAAASLTQGDLIPDCPLLTWNAEVISAAPSLMGIELQRAVSAFSADVLVMSQACDLEHGHVRDVILCPYLSLNEYQAEFEQTMREQGQNPSNKAWKRQCDDISNGYVWNLSMLNSEHHAELDAPHRIVDFHEVFTLPKQFLERFLAQRGQARLRLLPPYREHLSQAFARFFMRVGLPTPIVRSW